MNTETKKETKSVSDLKLLCPKATVKKGVAIKGSNAKGADASKIINQ